MGVSKLLKLSGLVLKLASGIKLGGILTRLTSSTSSIWSVTSKLKLILTLVLTLVFIAACANEQAKNKNNDSTNSQGDPSSPPVDISMNTQLDSDNDGIINAYDIAYDDKEVSVIGDGSAESPFIIKNIYQLQAIAGVDHTGKLLNASSYTNNQWLYGGNQTEQMLKSYHLGAHIGASITADWRLTGGAAASTNILVNATTDYVIGFFPIGNCGENNQCLDDDDIVFNGNFDGRSFVISNLHIYRPATSGVGLFGNTGVSALIDSLALTSIEITGAIDVGVVAGQSFSRITDSYAKGVVNGYERVGGLVGFNYGSIEGSYASGTITGINSVGGVAAHNSGVVSDSHSIGEVIGDTFVGGLVALNTGYIANCFANTIVSGNSNVGGLVGYNLSGITLSHSASSVTGDFQIGGLVGSNEANITNSYSLSAINGTNKVGGLIGANNGSVFNSYASTDVSGNNEVGGLVGSSDGNVSASYSLGQVEGNTYIGGLIGYGEGSIAYSFTHSNVSGQDIVGGLVGFYNASQGITASYAAGIVSADGQGTSGGLVGKSAADFFTSSYWNADNDANNRAQSRMPGSPRSITKAQFTSCGLNGMRHRSARNNVDCSDIFPADEWEGFVSPHGYSVSWDFSNPDDHPTLIVEDEEGVGILLPVTCVIGSVGLRACEQDIHIAQAAKGVEFARVIIAADIEDTETSAKKNGKLPPFGNRGINYDSLTAGAVDYQLSDAGAGDLFQIDAKNGALSMARKATINDAAVYRLVVTANVHYLAQGNSRKPGRQNNQGNGRGVGRQLGLTESYQVEFIVSLITDFN